MKTLTPTEDYDLVEDLLPILAGTQGAKDTKLGKKYVSHFSVKEQGEADLTIVVLLRDDECLHFSRGRVIRGSRVHYYELMDMLKPMRGTL